MWLKGIFSDKEFIKKLICIALYFLISMVLAEPIALLLRSIFSNMDIYAFSILFECVIYLIIFVITVLLMKNEFVVGIKPLKRKSAGSSIVEVLVGCAIVYGSMYVGTLITMALGESGNSANQEGIIAMLSIPAGAFMIPVLCVLGPIVEELVFRGAIQGGLEKLKVPRLLCVVVAGTLFGLIHVIGAGDFVQLPSYLITGLAFGFIYYRSENIYVPISVHIIWNCISTWSVYIMMFLEKLGFTIA